MQRRHFIRLSATGLIPLLTQGCSWPLLGSKYPVTVRSDRKTGHLVFESMQWPTGSTETTGCLIVGGGVAGLSAAAHYRGSDFLLCEAADRLGGSSSAIEHKGTHFSQGAHYELAYPDNYGTDGLDYLQRLGLLRLDRFSNHYQFTDRQYIVPLLRERRCRAYGNWRDDVLAEGPEKERFISLLAQYERQMPMPTRTIAGQHQHLNNTTFATYLRQHHSFSDDFMRGIDYHMLDDWGGTAHQVSALAGVHYFKCRPYYTEVVELFSPPQGNAYFIDRMAQNLPTGQLLTNHLVRRIKKVNKGFVAEVVDVVRQEVKLIKAHHVVYAGQKHALKYVYPEAYPLFDSNVYAPWLVMNIVVGHVDRPGKHDWSFWQNEYLGNDKHLLGFIDSSAQQGPKDYKVLTVYYCLPPALRNDLVMVESNPQPIVDASIQMLQEYLGKDMPDKIEQVYIHVMGHAMPIPVPGHLFNDRNHVNPVKGMAFAGVDNGRLPVFFEALDSGITAAQTLQNQA